MLMTNPSLMSKRAFTGSCHCGNTKYVAFLSFPPVVTLTEGPRNETFIVKCNCSTCHKMGTFHLRLQSSPDDFMLLSLSDPENGGLGDYQCFRKIVHWYFCKNCGVRCFAFFGTGKTVEIGADNLGASKEGEGDKTIKVWRSKKDGWVEVDSKGGGSLYLSVNAVTLDQGQEGLDLREWTEKKWIWYLNVRNSKAEPRHQPHENGRY